MSSHAEIREFVEDLLDSWAACRRTSRSSSSPAEEIADRRAQWLALWDDLECI